MSTTTTEQDAEIAIGAMALNTLSGDWRDRTIGLLKEYAPNYDKLSQAQQQDIIERATTIGRQAATQSLTLVAARALPSMGMRVKGVARKGKMMAVQLEGPFSQTDWNAWGSVEEMVALQASPDIYYGQRRPLYAKPDQTTMNLDEAGEADPVAIDDELAVRMQDEALGGDDVAGDDDALGPEAAANGAALAAGIMPLDKGDGGTRAELPEGSGGGRGDGGTAGESDPVHLAPRSPGRRRTSGEVAAANAAAVAATPARRGRKTTATPAS